MEEKRNNIQFHWSSTWLCGHRRLNVKRRVAGLNRIWCRVLCTSIWHFIYIVSINPSLIGADPCWRLTCDELVPFIWIELLTVNFNFGTKTKCIFYDFLSDWCPLRAGKLLGTMVIIGLHRMWQMAEDLKYLWKHLKKLKPF